MTHMQTSICLAVGLGAALALAFAIFKILRSTDFIVDAIMRSMDEAGEPDDGEDEDYDAPEAHPVGFHSALKV